MYSEEFAKNTMRSFLNSCPRARDFLTVLAIMTSNRKMREINGAFLEERITIALRYLDCSEYLAGLWKDFKRLSKDWAGGYSQENEVVMFYFMYEKYLASSCTQLELFT